MRKIISTGTIVLLSLSSVSAWAGNLTVPNAFVSGTKAVAADVNANFDAVATAVNDNDTRIKTNAADIVTNTAAIATKAAATDVTTNATNISANATAIATKANTTDVNTALAAKADASTVSTNTANISANATAIATKADASTVSTNTANISANATAIATKADSSTVSTNTANISANATAIAGKADSSTVTTNTTNITALQQNSNKSALACAGNDSNDIMVRVGPLCVDKYEASVWSTADGPSGGGLQLGSASDDYSAGTVGGITCSDNGNDCTGANTIYARSESGVVPSSSITWFQAQQACAASGKRLLTNAEWQMAAAGTDKTSCNISGGITANTDGNPACVSNWGVVNMVGNVNEWVSDWMQGATKTSVDVLLNPTGTQVINIPTYTTGSLGASYDNDITAGVQQANSTNFPAAVYRGGGAGGGGVLHSTQIFRPRSPVRL